MFEFTWKTAFRQPVFPWLARFRQRTARDGDRKVCYIVLLTDVRLNIRFGNCLHGGTNAGETDRNLAFTEIWEKPPMPVPSDFNKPPSSMIPEEPRDADQSSGVGTGKILFFVFGGCGLVAVLLLVGILVLGVMVFRTASSGIKVSVDRTMSQNQLRQLSLGLWNYQDTYRAFPASYNTDEKGRPLLSWRVHLLPFIEQEALYNQFKLDEPWDSPHNKKLIELMPEIYRSPRSEAPTGYTSYLGNALDEGLFSKPVEPMKDARDYHRAGFRVAQCTDAQSDTLLLIEGNDDHAVIWTQPGDFDPDINSDLFSWLMVVDGDFISAFVDGSTTIQPADNISNLRAELTRDGGEVIEHPWD